MAQRVSRIEPVWDSSDSEADEVPPPQVTIELEDGGHSHDPIPSGEERSGWWRSAARMVSSAVTSVTDRVFVGSSSRARSTTSDDGGISHEPFEEPMPRLYITEREIADNNEFIRTHRRNNNSSGDEVFSRTVNEAFFIGQSPPKRGHIDSYSGGGDLALQIDLVTSIRHYHRNPGDALYSLVGTALTNRAVDNPVSGEELLEANGDQALIALIIDSGCLDMHDRLVAEEIRRLVDERVVATDTGRVSPGIYAFLRELFSTSCCRITREQRDLLRISGFEFIELLHNNKHVMADIPLPSVCTLEFMALFSRKLDIILLMVGLGIIIFDCVAIAWVAAGWFDSSDGSESANGWITLVAWGVGDLLNFIAIRVMVATKADESVYGAAMADFPTPNLKALPIGFPLFEIFCFFAALKHKCIVKSNFVVKHDLVAMFTLSVITHSFFIATPQILIQSYLHIFIGDSGVENRQGFQLLTLSTLICLCTSMPLYLRFVVTFDSVNSVGFAYYGDRMPQESGPPVSKFSRVLAFLLLYLTEFNIFLLVLATLHIGSCGVLMIAILSVAGVVVFFTSVMFLVTVFYTRSILRASKWLILPLVVQIAFTVFYLSYDPPETDNKNDCSLFSTLGGLNLVYASVGWGMLIVLFVTWGIHKLWLSYQADRERLFTDSESVPAPGTDRF